MTSRNDEKGEITDGCVQWLKSNHQGGGNQQYVINRFKMK